MVRIIWQISYKQILYYNGMQEACRQKAAYTCAWKKPIPRSIRSSSWDNLIACSCSPCCGACWSDCRAPCLSWDGTHEGSGPGRPWPPWSVRLHGPDCWGSCCNCSCGRTRRLQSSRNTYRSRRITLREPIKPLGHIVKYTASQNQGGVSQRIQVKLNSKLDLKIMESRWKYFVKVILKGIKCWFKSFIFSIIKEIHVLDVEFIKSLK